MTKEFLRVGVIGCGWITREYKFITRFIKNTKIVAAMDLNREAAERVAGKEHAYTSTEEMYVKEDIDAVYVATPHHIHKKNIMEAFEQGKHVLCEKPVSVSIQDAREIKEMDSKYPNLKLGFNYNYRYDHKCNRLALGIQDAHLGGLYYANCNVFFSRSIDYFKQGLWRTKWDTSGGGLFIFRGCWRLFSTSCYKEWIKTLRIIISNWREICGVLFPRGINT